MRIFRDLPQLSVPSAVTVGTFDGLHLGHRKIIGDLLRVSHLESLVPTVITFYPHPRQVLFPEKKQNLILSQDEKLEEFESIGVENLIVLPFTKDFSRLSAEDFLGLLSQKISMRYLVSGFNNHFGCDRVSDVGVLSGYADSYGFKFMKSSAVSGNGGNISSTLIREAIVSGDIPNASKMLGYDYYLSGFVNHGKQLGRTIGFPTANISINFEEKLVPMNGVYLSRTMVDGVFYNSLLNVGGNPTVNGNVGDIFVENHILNFNSDIYGKRIKVYLLEKLREERRFSSVEALQSALNEDKRLAEKYFNKKD